MTPELAPSHSASPPGPLPPGWSSNPSAWSERLPAAALAALGVVLASYLALDQAGVLETVWEPFFGSGSQRVLHSRVSHLLPVPDGALGALGYLVELITCLAGGTDRWRARPWVVLLFGLTASLMALGGVLLAMVQPLAVGAWCTLCLTSAAISLAVVGPALREVLATLQHLVRVRRQGGSGSVAFWGRSESPQENSLSQRLSSGRESASTLLSSAPADS